VIHVTSLEDAGRESAAGCDAIRARTVGVPVSGTIALESDLLITSGTSRLRGRQPGWWNLPEELSDDHQRAQRDRAIRPLPLGMSAVKSPMPCAP